MTSLQQFFEKNSFIFGEKDSPKITPGNVPTILRLGLKNYYETYYADLNSGPINYTYSVFWGNDRSTMEVKPGVGCSHEFLARQYSAINYMQLFFELYIVEILDNISPIISRKEIKKEGDFLSELLKEGNEESAKKRTIAYSKILNRLQNLFDNDTNIPAKFRIPVKYYFLKEHLETLLILQDWRNKIMHSGKQVLFYYSFEVLFVNLVFPIVKKIINIQEDNVYMNRNLYCGLNVIEEFSKMKLPYDYLSVAKNQEIENMLKKVNHLKELGRASFINPLFMGEWGNEKIKLVYEEQNMRKRQIAEIEANVIKDPLRYCQKFNCPCCGTNAFMTFEYWTETINQKTSPHKAKCILCTYTIDKHIGEPQAYGIMKETIFNAID